MIPHQYVVDVAAPATCEHTGLTSGAHCSVCGTIFVKQEVIPATGHSWSEASYTWADDNRSVTANRFCLNDADHVEVETVDAVYALAKAPTETEAGETEYIAEFENPAFEKQVLFANDIPALSEMSVLRLPEQLYTIEDEAFIGLACEAVIIPDGCTSIGHKAFADCTNLVFVMIPDSVTDIADDAFEGCGQLRLTNYDEG